METVAKRQHFLFRMGTPERHSSTERFSSMSIPERLSVDPESRTRKNSDLSNTSDNVSFCYVLLLKCAIHNWLRAWIYFEISMKMIADMIAYSSILTTTSTAAIMHVRWGGGAHPPTFWPDYPPPPSHPTLIVISFASLENPSCFWGPRPQTHEQE